MMNFRYERVKHLIIISYLLYSWGNKFALFQKENKIVLVLLILSKFFSKFQ